MLKPYTSDITEIAVVFAHTGRKKYRNSRVYAVAATILSANGSSRTFESLIQYPHLTARDRYYSNISKETMTNAPEASAVFPRVKSFLKDTDIILTLPYQDNFEEINSNFLAQRTLT
jgi:ATP-dependent DNA helicase DinG